jgi:predicted nucleic acid-binding protein
LVERFELLTRVLGEPVMVSRIVYDPDDTGDELTMSEMVRSIHVQTHRAADPRRSEDERDLAGLFADRLKEIHDYSHTGRISIVDMSEIEQSLYGRLSADEHAPKFGLVFPLDDGEAASLAIAVERGWALASDDSDALRAMRSIRRNHPYQRIRKILINAADQGIIGRSEANAIHDEMRRAGFWDTTPPFTKEDP